MPTAPVGLRRMRELRNCHIKGNFVTVRREAAHERSRSKPRFSLARLRQTRGQHEVKNVVARDDGALRGQGAADAGTAFYVIVKKGGAVEGGAPSERELTPAISLRFVPKV